MLKTRTLSRLLPLLFLLPFVSQSGYAGIPGENDLNQMASDAISKVGTYKSMPISLAEEKIIIFAKHAEREKTQESSWDAPIIRKHANNVLREVIKDQLNIENEI